MTTYSTMALEDLLDAFSSSDPYPGGGSAAALGGALGVSLLLMGSGISRTKTGAPEETADLAAAASRLRPLRDALVRVVDADAEAYQGVIAAMRLPKASDDEKAARRDAIQRAMQAATETPLDTLRACQQALRGSVTVAAACTRNAASDVAVGIELLAAALRSAALNVDTNLPGLSDAGFVTRTRTERQELESEGLADAKRALALATG